MIHQKLLLAAAGSTFFPLPYSVFFVLQFNVLRTEKQIQDIFEIQFQKL